MFYQHKLTSTVVVPEGIEPPLGGHLPHIVYKTIDAIQLHYGTKMAGDNGLGPLLELSESPVLPLH